MMLALHAADLLAVWAQAAQQNPVVVQFAQNPIKVQIGGENSWDKWGPAVLQTLVSLASIIAAVTIAVVSFRNNRRVEHEQWLRDQKKAEWREVLSYCNSIAQDYLPPLKLGDSSELVLDRIRTVYLRVEGLPSKYVFISDLLRHNSLELSEFLRFLGDAPQLFRNLATSRRFDDHVEEEYDSVRNSFGILVSRIETCAQQDLGLWKENVPRIIIPKQKPDFSS